MLGDGTGLVMFPVSPERECCFSDPKVPWRTGPSLSEESGRGAFEGTISVVEVRAGDPGTRMAGELVLATLTYESTLAIALSGTRGSPVLLGPTAVSSANFEPAGSGPIAWCGDGVRETRVGETCREREAGVSVLRTCGIPLE